MQEPSYLTVKLIQLNKCAPTHQLTGLGPGRKMCLQVPFLQKLKGVCLLPTLGSSRSAWFLVCWGEDSGLPG